MQTVVFAYMFACVCDLVFVCCCCCCCFLLLLLLLLLLDPKSFENAVIWRENFLRLSGVGYAVVVVVVVVVFVIVFFVVVVVVDFADQTKTSPEC